MKAHVTEKELESASLQSPDTIRNWLKECKGGGFGTMFPKSYDEISDYFQSMSIEVELVEKLADEKKFVKVTLTGKDIKEELELDFISFIEIFLRDHEIGWKFLKTVQFYGKS